jgi:hypothetical protein
VVSPAAGGGASSPAFFQVAPSLGGLDLVSATTSLSELPKSMAAGDFNGDGNLDLVVANNFCGYSCNANATLFLGNGNGTFQPGVNYTVGKSIFSDPFQVIAADFNNDGNLDLAVADFNDGAAAILLGNGDGTFRGPREYTVGVGAAALVAGDFNADGNLDLALVNNETNVVTIILGNDDGTFRRGANYSTASTPYFVSTADVNGDGKLDLVITDDGSIAVLLGNGDGSFQKALKSKAPLDAGAVAVADFNGDGKLDLAMPAATGPQRLPVLAIMLGNGDGTFQSYKEYAADGIGAVGIALGDFNADGKLDVAMSVSSGSADVLLGNGDGTFQKSRSFAASPGAAMIAAGDFNNDGFLDLALGDAASTGTLSILLGTVAPVASVSPASLAFGDVTLGQVSPTQHATITNTGSAALDITSVTLSGSTEFVDTNSCPSSLQPAATCSVGVTFKASVGGATTGTLTIADSATGSPQTVSLTATAVPVGLSPSTLSFGSLKVGTSSPPQTITLTNVRNTPLEIYRVLLEGSDTGSFTETNNCPSGNLAAGGSCTITVTFTPEATGSLSADVDVQYAATGSPGAVPLSGTGSSN